MRPANITALAFIISLQILSTPTACASGAATGKIFTRAELQQDFTALRNRYETALANLYLYTSKPRLDNLFDGLYAAIEPMTAEKFYSYITPLSSAIKDGHSNLYPPEDVTAFHNTNSLFFPFSVVWQNNDMYVTQNLSNDTTISPGDELISINRISAAEVMTYLTERQVRDGENKNYAVWILNNYFREYYSYHYGHPATYELQIKRKGQLRTVSIAALSKDDIRANKARHYMAPLNLNKTDWQINEKTRVCTLAIKTWDDPQFKTKMDDLFAAMKKTNIASLIIDLRDNQGGNASNGIYLLSYLLNSPFEYFTEAKSVKKHAAEGQILQTEKWNVLGIHQPQKEIFGGKVFVLINGGSFSNSAAFCSRIAHYNRGILAGEETGGNKAVFSGSFGLKKNILLPHTKIICENTDYRLTVTDINDNNGHGVMPTHPFVADITDKTTQTDALLNYTLELIQREK